MNNQQAYEIMQIKATAFDEINKVMDTESDPVMAIVKIDIAVVNAEAEIEKKGGE